MSIDVIFSKELFIQTDREKYAQYLTDHFWDVFLRNKKVPVKVYYYKPNDPDLYVRIGFVCDFSHGFPAENYTLFIRQDISEKEEWPGFSTTDPFVRIPFKNIEMIVFLDNSNKPVVFVHTPPPVPPANPKHFRKEVNY